MPTIYTNNPIFGLNALGGAINFTMKNGFNFHGGDVTVLGGSYGRVNGFMRISARSPATTACTSPPTATATAATAPSAHRTPSASYLDLGYRSQDTEVHVDRLSSAARYLGVQGVDPAPCWSTSSTIRCSRRRRRPTTRPASAAADRPLRHRAALVEVASNFYIRQYRPVSCRRQRRRRRRTAASFPMPRPAIRGRFGAGTLCLPAD